MIIAPFAPVVAGLAALSFPDQEFSIQMSYSPGLVALGIVCLLVWGGLWAYLVALQRRLDKLEEDDPPEPGH